MIPQKISLVLLKLKDGLEIPKGMRIGWPGHNHSNDLDQVQDHELFDPMRNYRKRHANNGEFKNEYTAGQTDSNKLSFGFVSQACPGRYFAVNDILLMLAELLLEFDSKYLEGKTRAKTMYADEAAFLDPHAMLMMRKRIAVNQ